MIIFFCHKCGKKTECETKAQMQCDCGHYINKHSNAKDHVNMRTTWSGTTQVEFSSTTIEEDIESRNR